MRGLLRSETLFVCLLAPGLGLMMKNEFSNQSIESARLIRQLRLWVYSNHVRSSSSLFERLHHSGLPGGHRMQSINGDVARQIWHDSISPAPCDLWSTFALAFWVMWLQTCRHSRGMHAGKNDLQVASLRNALAAAADGSVDTFPHKPDSRIELIRGYSVLLFSKKKLFVFACSNKDKRMAYSGPWQSSVLCCHWTRESQLLSFSSKLAQEKLDEKRLRIHSRSSIFAKLWVMNQSADNDSCTPTLVNHL